MNIRLILLWLCQILAAVILLRAGVLKFLGADSMIAVFTQLEMEPLGRYLIATLECLAALLLLSGHFAALGAALALSLMCGATLAHLTRLEMEPVLAADSPIFYLVVISVCSLIVLYARRKSIPILGETL